MFNDMILAKDTYLEGGFKKNHNVVVLGTPGTGKTRHYILPNLCNMKNSSAVLLDPKGELYDLTSEMMKKRGFKVKLIDFDNPSNPNTCYYNPLRYCKTSDDVLRITNIILLSQKENTKDMFWPCAAQLLANSVIGYLISECRPSERTLENAIKLLKTYKVKDEMLSEQRCPLDVIFSDLEKKKPDSWCVEQYNLFNNSGGSPKTCSTVVLVLVSAFAFFMSDGIKHLTHKDTIDLKSIGETPTVVYVKSSDSDRSRDELVSIFFEQTINQLFNAADGNDNHTLKVHTHFFLDDLGTNLTIRNLPSYLAACRSREISMSVVLQSIGQLKTHYKEDYSTILGSCASTLFLGSNDIETCEEFAKRLNKPLSDVLYKDYSSIFVFTQGEKPVHTQLYDLQRDENYKLINELKKEEVLEIA